MARTGVGYVCLDRDNHRNVLASWGYVPGGGLYISVSQSDLVKSKLDGNEELQKLLVKDGYELIGYEYESDSTSWTDISDTTTFGNLSGSEIHEAYIVGKRIKKSNPTISQLFIDGVTYDLKDKNSSGGGVTEEQLPEVVSETPTTYVTDKLYLIVKSDGGSNQDSNGHSPT